MKEISPKKRFGQNFINDEVLLSDLVDLINVKKNDDFLEIGPGSGNLTSLIVSIANSCSCLLYTSPSPRDKHRSRMPSSA